MDNATHAMMKLLDGPAAGAEVTLRLDEEITVEYLGSEYTYRKTDDGYKYVGPVAGE